MVVEKVICFILTLLFFNYVVIYDANGKINTDNETVLVIGIFSAPENYKQRQSIRNTWLTLTTGLSIKYFFLIGDICDIPLEDRINSKGCQRFPLNLSKDNLEENFTTAILKKKTWDNKNVKDYIGFGFIPLHTIIISKLGLCATVLYNAQTPVQVKLVSPYDNTVLVAVNFYPKEAESNKLVYLFKTIPSIKISKDYEVRIVLDVGRNVNTTMAGCDNLEWNLSTGVINIIQLINNHQQKPELFDIHSCSYVVMQFAIYDINAVWKHINDIPKRMGDWKKQKGETLKSIRREEAEHKDIMQLDLIDVYSNLPLKLLTFLHRISKQVKFLYALKSDDDTFIDVGQVYKEVIQADFASDKLWLWSHLREFWKVQTVGKWRDDMYKSVSYPPFPCGAGYVMSRALANYVSANRYNLRQYQGEDVSLGIWMASLVVQHHQTDYYFTRKSARREFAEVAALTKTCPVNQVAESPRCQWNCGEGTQMQLPLCNKVQLLPADMYTTWYQFLKTGYLQDNTR